eukprot:scaffold9462_cov132-Skeletonema_menzelii.AAC.1
MVVKRGGRRSVSRRLMTTTTSCCRLLMVVASSAAFDFVPRRRPTKALFGAANPPYQPYHHQQQQYSRQTQPLSIATRRKGTGGYMHDVRYGEFLKLVAKRKIEKVTFNSDGTQLIGQLVRPKPKKSWFWKSSETKYREQQQSTQQPTQIRIPYVPNDPTLLSTLTDYKIDISVSSSDKLPGISSPRRLFSYILRKLLFPISLFAGLFFLLRKSTSSSTPLSLAKMKPSFNFNPNTGVTFDDVAGCDGAKLELAEIVDFLKQPQAYTNNGCRIPRGVLLHGPPGTGKTLLAKAVAGEANVPFVSISGSEFVELYVGVGASRVRELFFQAKRNSPCIVFLDEIDAVGRQRGAGYAGGNDEREQTINQILVEMDGFEGNPAVITLAATNRIDVLDEALMRPGRFDRKVAVDLPDVQGRGRILEVHARGKPLEPDVDLDAISRRTPGFSGAMLENLMNEAALSAARRGKSTIGWEEVDGALDRLIVGLEKKGGTKTLSPKQVEIVAYHEAGHAVCGALIPDYDQVQKISIIPRSNGAGGLTFFSPQESRLESGMYSKQYLEGQLVVALGGRLAEEIIYGEDLVTTGASNDLEQVANIAKRMVKEWGMSDKVGLIALSTPHEGGPFMGRSMGQRGTQWGNKIMGYVDSEVERLVNNSYLTAKRILSENMPLLHHLAKTLVEQEVVTAEEFQMMLIMFNAKVVEYTTFESNYDERKRAKLPFQKFPDDL